MLRIKILAFIPVFLLLIVLEIVLLRISTNNDINYVQTIESTNKCLIRQLQVLSGIESIRHDDIYFNNLIGTEKNNIILDLIKNTSDYYSDMISKSINQTDLIQIITNFTSSNVSLFINTQNSSFNYLNIYNQLSSINVEGSFDVYLNYYYRLIEKIRYFKILEYSNYEIIYSNELLVLEEIQDQIIIPLLRQIENKVFLYTLDSLNTEFNITLIILLIFFITLIGINLLVYIKIGSNMNTLLNDALSIIEILPRSLSGYIIEKTTEAKPKDSSDDEIDN